jgi:HK97 family phage prohead protease
MLRRFRFVARGAELPDRNRVIVRLAGLDLANYAANGPVLLGHEPLWLVGQAHAYIAAGRLLADVTLAPARATALADQAAALVAAGVLRGLSVGVRPLRSKLSDDGKVLDIQRGELLEVSLVAIPADASALRIA